MKRTLPTPRQYYVGPDSADKYLRGSASASSFLLWAHVDLEGTRYYVQLERTNTIEAPGTKTVKFDLLPQGLLLTRVPYYAHPSLVGVAECDWSNFLRLTRWRKHVSEYPIEKQALIARIEPVEEPAYDTWVLVAVDDDIRRKGPLK